MRSSLERKKPEIASNGRFFRTFFRNRKPRITSESCKPKVVEGQFPVTSDGSPPPPDTPPPPHPRRSPPHLERRRSPPPPNLVPMPPPTSFTRDGCNPPPPPTLVSSSSPNATIALFLLPRCSHYLPLPLTPTLVTVGFSFVQFYCLFFML